jgi:hypothetical protein
MLSACINPTKKTLAIQVFFCIYRMGHRVAGILPAIRGRDALDTAAHPAENYGNTGSHCEMAVLLAYLIG